MNRLAPEKHIQLFGDGVHKFYLEERCTDPKMDGSPLCLKCSAPNTSKKQYARTFPRGLINEPIPPDIHLFDSPWYHQQVKKWGAPSARVIMYALEFQQEARKGTSLDPSKVVEPLLEKDNMPRKAAVSTVSAVSAVSVVSAVSAVKEETISIPNVDTPVVKKTRKPRTAKRAIVDAPILPMEPISTTYPPSDSLSVLSLFQQEQEEKKEQEQEHEKGQEQEQEQEDKKGKKKAVKRKPSVKKDKKEKTETVYDKLVHPYPVVHKDSCIPTHLEQSIEEQSLSDYETEIIPFSIFILDNVVYFRDSKKNKLYRRIKEKTIGQYVGRYDSYTDSIVTDIPDSDDECD